MFLKSALILTAGVLSVALSGNAASIALNSDTNTTYKITSTSATGNAVVITPHPAWEVPGSLYKWISYAQTGVAVNLTFAVEAVETS